MNADHGEDPPARSAMIEFDVGNEKDLEQQFEIDGMKFKAEIIQQWESNELSCKYTIKVVCNENLLNNLWKCSASFEVKDRIVPFVFDCYHKTWIMENLLLDESTFVILKTTLEEVVGFQLFPTFDFGIPGFSDVKFLVGEQNFYAHKSILAINSNYFSAMFLSSFAEKTLAEIRLEDVNPDEFREFLNVLYPTNNEVTENNVECLLRIADMYQAESVLKKCEKFLEKTYSIKLSKKLEYVERYRLRNLEKTCILGLGSIMDVQRLFNDLPGKDKEEKLDRFSAELQTLILERYVHFHSYNFNVSSNRWKELTVEDENTVEKKFEEWKDTILKVEGVELLVNRAYLSIFSSYFQELFYEDVEKNSFELEHLKCDDFLELLSYVRDPEKKITEKTIDNVTSLSVKFGVPYLLKLCKQYWLDIIEENDYKSMDKKLTCMIFDVSEMFGFSEVQELMLTRLRDRKETGTVLLWPEYEILSSKSRLAILRCYFTHNSYNF